MKILATPLTSFLWYLTCYLGLYYGHVLIIWMFSLSLFWVIIGFAFLVGIISGLTAEIPSLLNQFILVKFYNRNKIAIVLHSIAGFIGIFLCYKLLYFDNPISMGGNSDDSWIGIMWEISALKTFLVMIPYVALNLSLCFTSTISPLLLLKENPFEE